MRYKTAVTFRLLIAILWGNAIVNAALGPSDLDLVSLANRADIIIFGTVRKAIPREQQAANIELLVTRAIKGNVGASSLTAAFYPSPLMIELAQAGTSVFMPGDISGKSGLWFIKSNGGDLQVLPLGDGNYDWNDLFLPLLPSDLSSAAITPGGSIEQTITAAILSWYRSLSNPTFSDDNRLLATLRALAPENSLSAANTLIGSPSLPQHIIGLIAAVDTGSDSGLNAIADELPSLSTNPKFPELTASIAANYQMHGPGSIQALRKFAGLHSSAPGLDAAVGTVLQRNLDKKSVYPIAASLLESRDPDAQLRASWIFGYYALFCDKNGNLSQPGLIGPFAAASREFMPTSDSLLTPAEYAAFWKSWWAKNKSALGF